MVYQFYGNQITCKVGDAWTTIATDTDLDTDFDANASGTDFSNEVTEATFTDGESGVEILNVFGTQLKGESRPELVRVDFTMVMDDLSMFNQFYGSTTIVATTWSRQAAAEKTGSREDKAILFVITDGTRTQHILLNNAWFLSGGEVSLPADGRVMWSGSAVCLVSDLYVEDNY